VGVTEVVELTDSRKTNLVETLSKLRECPGKALCAECFWWVENGGQCSGCDDDYQQRCLKRVCNYDCYQCSGGRLAIVPGCCGRTVVLQPLWRDRFEEILEYPVDDYTPDPPEITCRLIPIIYPQIRKFRIPDEFPQIDAWAVPMHKVTDKKGQFITYDLKDYLSMSVHTTLILLTCAPDDYQEMLWEEGPQIEYRKKGIDYWFPGHFSVYDDDSKLYQFVSAKRQQIHATLTGSQFVWFRLGENIPIKFLNPIRKAPAVLISTNQMYSKRNKQFLLEEVKEADRWFPKDTKFFIVGSPRQLDLSDGRKCFEINTDWLMSALKGRDLTGQLQLDKEGKLLETGERLTNNLSEAVKNVC
jgi:hypothetical protein